MLLPGSHVGSHQIPSLREGEVELRVVRMIDHFETIPKTDHPPIVVQNSVRLPGTTRSRPAAVILHSAHDPVEGLAEVRVNVIRLSDRQVVDILPRASLVVRDRDPTIVANPDPFWMEWIDPHGVIIDVDFGCDRPVGSSPIDRNKEGRRDGIDTVLILGIDSQICVIKPAGDDVGLSGDRLEVLPLVLGSKERSLFRLGDDIDDLRVGRSDLDADPPHQRRKPFGQSLPRLSSVDRFEDAPFFAPTGEGPGLAFELPHCGIDDVRIDWINVQVGDSV